MDKTKYFIRLDLNKICDYYDNCKTLLQFKEFEATLETRLENTFVFELSNDFSKIIIPYNWILFMIPIN